MNMYYIYLWGKKTKTKQRITAKWRAKHEPSEWQWANRKQDGKAGLFDWDISVIKSCKLISMMLNIIHTKNEHFSFKMSLAILFFNIYGGKKERGHLLKVTCSVRNTNICLKFSYSSWDLGGHANRKTDRRTDKQADMAMSTTLLTLIIHKAIISCIIIIITPL